MFRCVLGWNFDLLEVVLGFFGESRKPGLGFVYIFGALWRRPCFFCFVFLFSVFLWYIELCD